MLLKSALAGAISLGLLAGCGQPSLEDQLQTAQEALKSDNYQEAVVTLRNAVQTSPDDTQARILLAKTYYGLGDMESAVSSFEKAINMNADVSDFASEYFTALYASGETEQFDSIFGDLEGKLNSQAKAKGQAIAALLAARSNEADKAQSLFAQATQGGDAANKMLQDLSVTYLINRDTDNTQVLERAAKEFKDDWLVSSLVGEIAYRLKDYELTTQTYKRMLEEKPMYLRLNLNISQAYLQLNDYAGAKPYVDNILKRFKDQPLANQQKALIAISEQDFEQANVLIERAMANGMASPLTSYIAGLTNFRVGNYEQAIQNLSKIVNDVPATHPAKQMYVAAKLQVGASRDAFNMMLSNPEMTAQNTNLAVNTSFSLLESGRTDDAKKIIDTIDMSKVDTDRKRQQLGMLKALSGDATGAQLIEESSKAILNNPDTASTSQSKALLLSMKTSSGDTAEAREMLDSWISEEPNNVQNYLLSAELEKYLGNTDNLPGIYSKVLELEPENVIALNDKAARAFNQGEFAQAKAGFGKVLEQAPNNRNALLGSFRSLAALQESPQPLVKQITGNDQTSAFTRLYAQYLAGNYAQVIEIGNEAAFNGLDEPMAKYLLGDSLIKTGKPQRAVDVLRRLVIEDKANNQILLTLAKAQAMNNRPNEALKTLSGIDKSNTEAADQAAMIEARIQLGKKSASNAKTALQKVTDVGKGDPEYQLLMGRINLLLGNNSEAVNQLKDAYSARPITAAVQYYYQALKASGQEQQGVSVLEKHLSNHSNDIQVTMMLAGELAQSEPEKAIGYYQQVVDSQPKNWIAMNNLAWLLGQQNRLDEAHKLIRQALQLKPGNQSLLDTKSGIEAKM